MSHRVEPATVTAWLCIGAGAVLYGAVAVPGASAHRLFPVEPPPTPHEVCVRAVLNAAGYNPVGYAPPRAWSAAETLCDTQPLKEP